MTRRKKVLATLVLTPLGLAVIAAVLGVYFRCPAWPRRVYYTTILGRNYMDKEVQFDRISTGVWMRPRGQEGTGGVQQVNSSWHISSDCVRVLVKIETYGSESEAEKRMQELIAQASRVVERNERVNHNGERIGPKAVLLVGQKAMVIWTNKNDVVSIHSSSLVHALELERRTSASSNTSDTFVKTQELCKLIH